MKAIYSCMLACLLLLGTVIAAQEKQTAGETQKPSTAAASTAPAGPHVFSFTPEDSARKNPQRYSEISVERGKKIYLTQCAMCHGEKGDGKGDLAKDMSILPPDFTNPEILKKRTDGELFTIIGTGSPTMPSQEKRMQSVHRWEIVNYLRSLSGKVPEKSTAEELQQGTVIVRDKN